MLEAMMPAGFGPTEISSIGLGGGVPDCNSYNPQLAFKAIFGKTKEQARQMVTSDATTQILEHELDSKVNFVDFIIKKTAITDRSGRQITKEVLWSLDSDKSIQRATNMEECNGQVWEMTNRVSDRVVNTPGESWHLAISPGEKEEHRAMLFHNRGDDSVREYFITLRAPRKTLDRLFENITGQRLATDQSISDVIVSRRKDQGETSITPRDVYNHFANTLDEKETIARSPFLRELKKDAYLSEKDLEIRNAQVTRLISKQVKEILSDRPTLSALGLVAQSIPKWAEKVKDLTNWKVLDESAKQDLISRTTGSDLIIKPETDYKADNVVVLPSIAQGFFTTVSQKAPIYYSQNNRLLQETQRAEEAREQISLQTKVSNPKLNEVEKEEKLIEAVVAPLVIPAISYILDHTHTNPPQQASVLNQDILFVNHFENSLTLKDAIQQPLGLLSRCKFNEDGYIKLEKTQDEFIKEVIAPISPAWIGVIVAQDYSNGEGGRHLISSEIPPLLRRYVGVGRDDERTFQTRPQIAEDRKLNPIWQLEQVLRGKQEEMAIDVLEEKIKEQILGDPEVWQEIVFASQGIALRSKKQENYVILEEEAVIFNDKLEKEPINIVKEALSVILAFNSEMITNEIVDFKSGEKEGEISEIKMMEKEMVDLGREIFRTYQSLLDSSTVSLERRGVSDDLMGSYTHHQRLCRFHTPGESASWRITPGVSDALQIDIRWVYLGESYRDSLVRLGVFLATYSKENISQEVKSLLSALVYREIKNLKMENLTEGILGFLPIVNYFEKLFPPEGEVAVVFEERLKRLVSVISQIIIPTDFEVRTSFKTPVIPSEVEESNTWSVEDPSTPPPLAGLVGMTKRQNLDFEIGSKEREWRRDKFREELGMTKLEEFILDNILFIFYYLISYFAFERLVPLGRLKTKHFDPKSYKRRNSNSRFPVSGVIYVYNLAINC